MPNQGSVPVQGTYGNSQEERTLVRIAPLVLNPREAAKYIGVGRTKFFELLKDGKIPMRKSGKHTLVKVADLDAWVEGLPFARGRGCPEA